MASTHNSILMRLFWIGIYSILLIAFITTYTQAQSNVPEDVEKLWQQAKAQTKAKAYDAAVDAYEQAINLFQKNKQQPNYQIIIARLYHGFAALHSTDKLANFQLFFEYQMKAKEAIQQTNDVEYKGDILYQAAIAHYYYQQFRKSAPLLEEVIALAQQRQDYVLEIRAMNVIGRVYMTLSMYDISLSYLEKAERLLLQHPDTPEAYAGQVYFNLSLIKYTIDNYEGALVDSQKALPLWNTAYGKEHYRVVSIYNQIARIYFLLGNTEQTKVYLQKVFAIDNPQVRKGRGGYLNLLGEVYHREKRYKKAIQAFQEAIQVQIKTFGGDTPDNTEIYRNLSRSYRANKQFELALTNIQRALVLNNSAFRSTNYADNPTLKGAVYNELQIHLLSEKANIWHQRFKASQNIDHLQQSYQVYRFLLKEVKNWKTSLSDENNLLLLIKRSNYIFTNAIEVLYTLYKLTQKTLYLKEAFHITEQAKAYVLLRSLYLTSKSPNNSHHQAEYKINHSLKNLKEQLIAEENKANPDTKKVVNFKDQIFELKASRDSLLNAFQKFSPEYYQTKYQFKIASVNSIQKKLLGKQEALLEYMLTDKHVFVFVVTSQTITLKKVSFSSNINTQMKELRQSITQKNFRSFVKNSHFFYQKLVSPAALPAHINKLYIIPSGILYHLPWEALIMRNPANNAVNYRQQAYLLKQYTISYDYSATLVLNKVLQKRTNKRAQLLAFAPEFSSGNDYMDDTLRSKLASLSGAQKEVKMLHNLYQGELFTGQNATEQKFRTHIKNASVLHLATHAVINDQHPALSKLLFSLSPTDTLNDGYLHAYELHNLQLNTELVTLSACNTGFGKIQTGEGVMSLGRAFAYAGSPNVLMSLWSVPDRSTSKIMTDFYKYLANGTPKDVALRKAKLAYINNADHLTSNPFYWSSFVLIGNAQPLQLQINNAFYQQGLFLWGAFMLLGVLILLFIKKSPL